MVEDILELARTAAELIVSIGNDAIRNKGAFNVALSGGRTPEPIYRLLAEEYGHLFPWSRTRFFWLDERCVPPEHADSNFNLARKELLRYINPGAVFRMKGELPPEEAAKDYESLLQEEFRVSKGDIPEFDLILLGIGTDGHVASIFPSSQAMVERKRLVISSRAPDSGGARITLTLPVINESSTCLFIAAGHQKKDIARRILDDSGDDSIPARLINPANGRIVWVLDRSAYPFGIETL